ncbi:hypothetical protein ALC57_09850, partial [Trachymyrmex cornetzi]
EEVKRSGSGTCDGGAPALSFPHVFHRSSVPVVVPGGGGDSGGSSGGGGGGGGGGGNGGSSVCGVERSRARVVGLAVSFAGPARRLYNEERSNLPNHCEPKYVDSLVTRTTKADIYDGKEKESFPRKLNHSLTCHNVRLPQEAYLPVMINYDSNSGGLTLRHLLRVTNLMGRNNALRTKWLGQNTVTRFAAEYFVHEVVQFVTKEFRAELYCGSK